MLNLSEKITQRVVWGFMALMLAIVVLTFRHYGVTWDEELQSQYGQAVADYYLSGFADGRYDEIFNLYLYGGMFDGLAALIDRTIPYFIYDTRHLLNALFGLLGLWGTWRLGRFMGGTTIGMIAVFLCASVPSYYGHMFNNPKDIPFAAGIVWSIYYMSRLYTKERRDILVKLGFTLGLTLGVRIGGAMVVAFWLAPMGIVALLPWFRQRNRVNFKHALSNIWSLAWRCVIPVGVLSYAVMLICWPWAQQAPIMNPLRALSEFSNFPQVVEVLLDGTTYESTQLPWYYVPLYFGIQLPEYILILLAASFVFIPRIWPRFSLPQKQSFSLILLMISFPITYAVLRHPALYDTVRHFMFAIPLGCIICAITLREIYLWAEMKATTIKSRRLISGGFVVMTMACLLSQVVIMVKLHPYEYIYANQLAGGVHGAFGRYETDYWGSSFKEAAQELQAYVAKEGGVPPGKIYKIAICGPWAAAMLYLPPDYQPVVANEPAEFFLSTTRWMCQNMRPGEEIIRVQRMGVPLSIVKDLRNGYAYYEGNSHMKKAK